jgi:hypothetical protein
MHNQPQVLRNAVAAVIAGSLAGAAAGLWSVHSWPPTITASAQTPIVEAVVASPAPPAVPAPLPTASTTPSKSPSSLPAAGLTSQGAPAAANPLQRARELARRPDVRGLLAVREEIAQRAASQNGQDSSESRRQLDEIDRYLGEARALQLRLDAQELRRSAAIPAESR